MCLFSLNCACLQDYSVPEYFSEDLFSVLGASRPNFRWLIIGPSRWLLLLKKSTWFVLKHSHVVTMRQCRSGSSFHIDPNSTSAWNAVIRGQKKWIMFPPGCAPPGIFPSADGAEVTAPVSMWEWLSSGFYEEMADSPVPPVEGLCRAGEMVFVPHGWWHAVLNLEIDDDDNAVEAGACVAITQNFVSGTNASAVCRFLRDKRDQVSGCGQRGATLFEEFMQALRAQRRPLAHLVEEQLSQPVSLWDAIKASKTPPDDRAETEVSAFSFSFG